MSDWLPSYEYEGTTIKATFEGRVIASGEDFSRVSCDAEEYLDSLKKERKASRKEAKRTSATHIQTPNGLRGEILSRVEGLWGEEITVRFDNGRIARLETAPGDGIKFKVNKEAAAPTSYREVFEQKLAAEYAPTREGLIARHDELATLRRDAAAAMATESSFAEQKAIHHLTLAAEAEQMEIQQALAHLDAVDAENAAPAPPQYVAAEQASMGRDDSWLEVTAREMIAESEEQDFDKILAEGPAVLASDMDDAAVSDAGIARGIALAHIVAKTAGFQGEAVEAYREQFVAAVETARRHELKIRTKVARTAATQVEADLKDVGDEALFF